jgi:vesicle coat complex subunit
MEVFDRIIGAHIDEITIPQVFEAFIAFSTAEKADIRPKITALLLSTLADSFD